MKLKRRISTAILTLFMLVTCFLFLFPTICTIADSFMTSTEITAAYGKIFTNVTSDSSKSYIAKAIHLKLIPDKVSFTQYKTILFTSPEYLLKFWNSVILVVPIVIFQSMIALLAAYGFSRKPSRLKNLIFFFYIILMLMPYQVTSVPNFVVAEKLGILNTRPAIWLPGIFAPFAVFILTKYMRRIPSGIIEAAKLDGASELQIFTRVCAPMSKSILVSVLILIYIDYWNMVEQPLILLSDDALHPLSVFLSRINTEDAGLAFCSATIYMVIPILIFLYCEDYLVEGVSYAGGIKG